MPDAQWKVRERQLLGRFTDPVTGLKVGRLPSNGHAQSDGRIPAMPGMINPKIDFTPLTREKITANVAAAIKQAETNTPSGNLTAVSISVTKAPPGKKVRRIVLMSVLDFIELVPFSSSMIADHYQLTVPSIMTGVHPPIDVEFKTWAKIPPKLIADLDTVTANAQPDWIPVAIITALENNLTFVLMDAEDFVALASGESTRTYTTATIGA